MAAQPEITISPQGVELRAGDSWCSSRLRTLRGGMVLDLTTCRFDPSLRFPAEAPRAEIELVVSSGAVIETRGADGSVQRRGGNTIAVGSRRNAEPLVVAPTSDAEMRSAGLLLGASQLHELLGGAPPEPIARVLASPERHPRHVEAMTPALVDLLDELTIERERSKAYGLWIEGKALELIALATDALVASHEAETRPLTTSDADGLERARAALIARLDEAPTLRALARQAGMSETKLKAGFKRRFGTSVFDHLRAVRLEEARRRLISRAGSVTEIAVDVGYVNPSKFAAAFRRAYGVSPSELAAAGSAAPRLRG